MPEQQTHADALRLFHSGAATLDAVQNNPALSLGGRRSCSQVMSMNIAGSLAGVTVLFASAAHGQTTGTLTANTDDTLSWTPSSAAAGLPVTVLHGQSVLLEAAGFDGAKKFLCVRRDTTEALAGSATLTLSFTANNAIALDDVDAASALTGRDDYRLLCVRNVSGHVVRNIQFWIAALGTQQICDAAHLGNSGSGSIISTASLSDWPQVGFCHIRDAAGFTREIVYYSARTDHMLCVLDSGRARLATSATEGYPTDSIMPVPGLRIGLESPASQPDGLFQTIATSIAAPTGVAWSLGNDASSGLSPGDLNPDWMHGLWIHREIPPGAVATPAMQQQIMRRFEAM